MIAVRYTLVAKASVLTDLTAGVPNTIADTATVCPIFVHRKSTLPEGTPCN